MRLEKYRSEGQRKAFERYSQRLADIEAKYPNDSLGQVRELNWRNRISQANYRRQRLHRMTEAIERRDTQKAIEAANSACGICDSERRLKFMYQTLAPTPPEIFWPVWMMQWTGIDYSAHWHEILPGLFRGKGPAEPYYTDDQRATFGALPNKIMVYRGCDANLTHGVSWSLREEVAKYFANGGYGSPRDPVLLTGEIAKDSPDLFYVIGDDRREAEIVCLPKIIETEPQTPKMAP